MDIYARELEVAMVSSTIIAVAMVVWLPVFVVLKVAAARFAVRVRQEDFFSLLTSMAWMVERDRPWTGLGRAAVAWLFLYPPLVVLVVVVWPRVRS